MKIIPIAALLFALLATASHAQDGLLGYWRFDEGSGDVATDSSDNGNNGTIIAPEEAWVTDPDRGSVYQSGNGSFVELGEEVLPVLALDQDFTWSFWVKPGETDNNNIVLGNRWGPDGSDFAPREFIKFTPRKFEWHYDGGAEDIPSDNTMFVVDEWSHNLVVKRGTALTYYRDNEVVGESEVTDAPVNPQPLYLGGQNGAENFSGQFDEVAIWDRALSIDEVATVFQRGQSGDSLSGAALELDFNDKAQFDELEVVSNEAATTEWRSTGGVDDSGYISLTDPENGARAAIIFPSIDRPISGFDFSVDARIGGGTDDPADGFSINIVRPDDPLLNEEVNGGRGEGYASSPTGEGNLPEEGSQTGLGIGFDAWFSGGSDTIGFSVRVDNEILAEIPAETKNGEPDDVTSLQTGPQNFDGDDPLASLTWQRFTASLDPTTNVLSITWKGKEVFNEKIQYFPSPGTVVFGARTGGANQAHHFDNLTLETKTAIKPVIVRKVIDRNGLTIRYQNFPESSLDPDTVKLAVDGEDVSSSTTRTTTEEDDKLFLTLSYSPPEPWAFSSSHDWTVEGTDNNGNTISNVVEGDVIKPPSMGGDPLPGPAGGEGVAGGRWIWGTGTQIGSLAAAVDTIRGAAEAGFEGQVLDLEHEVVNHGAGAGLFTEDIPYPEDAEGDENWTGEDFIQFVRGTIRIPTTGDYTFAVHSDDGFGLRIWGAEFTSESGAGNIDSLAANSLIHINNTGDSNSRGHIANMQAGDYELEFFWWERGGGDYGELYYAPGIHDNDEDTDQWELVGQGDVQWVGEPLPVPNITSVSVAADVAVAFTTPDAEANHVLQQSLDLIQWSDLIGAKLSNEGEVFSFNIARPAGPTSYFRVGILPPPPLFYDGFEGGLQEGWEAAEPWATGTTSTGPGAAFAGDNVYATNLEGAFPDLVQASLKSPVVDLTGVTRPKLTFQYYIDATEGSEGVQLKYLNADGSELFVEEDIFWGQSDGWQQYRKTIPSAAQDQPIRIEFLLLSDDSGPNGDGFYLDDFTIDD